MAKISNIEDKNDKSSLSDFDSTGSQGRNMALSAGAPGSAGIIGSKKWMAAHRDKTGNITTELDEIPK